MRSDPELHSMADLAALTVLFVEHRSRLQLMLRGRIDRRSKRRIRRR